MKAPTLQKAVTADALQDLRDLALAKFDATWMETNAIARVYPAKNAEERDGAVLDMLIAFVANAVHEGGYAKEVFLMAFAEEFNRLEREELEAAIEASPEVE